MIHSIDRQQLVPAPLEQVFAHAAIVRRDPERVFDYRRQRVERRFRRTGAQTEA